MRKNEKEYTVTERKGYWSVSLASGGLTIDYQVSKDICKTEAELQEFKVKLKCITLYNEHKWSQYLKSLSILTIRRR